MDDLQDLLEAALENAEDLQKEIVKAIEAAEEKAKNTIEVSPISQGVVKVFTPGGKYGGAYLENDEQTDTSSFAGEAGGLEAVKIAMERMQDELRKTLTHLYDQGPETRECLEAVDMSRQDLISSIDDYKLNNGSFPDPFEGLIEQLEKFVEAPSSRRRHEVSRHISDMVLDKSLEEEAATDLKRQAHRRNHPTGHYSPEKKLTRTLKTLETDTSPISVLQGDIGSTTKPTWVFEAGRYRILRDVSEEAAEAKGRRILFNPINPIKTVGSFLLTNTVKFIHTSAVVCVKGALVLSPIAALIAVGSSWPPHQRAKRAKPTLHAHTGKKSPTPATTPVSNHQVRKSAQVHYPNLTLNEKQPQDSLSEKYQYTYMHFENSIPRSVKPKPNLYSGQG